MARVSAILLALLAPVVSLAEDEPCRREADGRVSCSADGFRALTDAVVVARTDSRFCAATLEDKAQRLATCQSSLDICNSAPAPVSPAVEPRPIVRQLVGLGISMVAAVAATLAGTQAMDDGVRAATWGAAATAAVGGAVLVLW